MLASLAGSDLWIVAVIIVVLFGGSQLPKIARNVGMAGKEFRKAHDEASKDDVATPAPTVTPAPPMVAAAPPVVPAANPDDRITLSKAQLDALLDEREARAKGQTAS